MRSIRYALGGNPHNLDDCLDFSLKENPIEVSLYLTTKEEATEEWIIRRLMGVYNWKFPNITVEYEEIYGGCFFHETVERQKFSIDNANCRLEYVLKEIKVLSIDVLGKEKRFDYSVVYR